MAKTVSAATAKAHFSSLIAEVAYGGAHYMIERRGKPIAALVSVEDLERIEQGDARSSRPRGALGLVGRWRDVGDDKIDAVVDEIYASRLKDTGRNVELEA